MVEPYNSKRIFCWQQI